MRLLRELLEVTQILIIQNPDHVTALSVRRQVLIEMGKCDRDEDEILKSLSDEVAFTTLILSIASHAKSASLWEHRRWCLVLLHPAHRAPVSINTGMCRQARVATAGCASDQELDFTLRCADAYPRNYFAWRHRIWLINGLQSHSDEHVRPALIKELNRITRFWSSHPRDHSCTHYLSWLIKTCDSIMIGVSDSMSPVVNQEMDELLTMMVSTYKDSEASWLLFRNLITSTSTPIYGLILKKTLAEEVLKTLVIYSRMKNFSLKDRFLAHLASNQSSTITLAARETLTLCHVACLGIRTFYWMALQVSPYYSVLT